MKTMSTTTTHRLRAPRLEVESVVALKGVRDRKDCDSADFQEELHDHLLEQIQILNEIDKKGTYKDGKTFQQYGGG